MKLLIKQSSVSSEWYWTLIARNGRIIAYSAETYKNKSHIIRMGVKVTRCNRIIEL